MVEGLQRCGPAALPDHRSEPRYDREPGCSRDFADGWRRTSRLEDTPSYVSYLAMHIELHLAELDINPLIVLPSGQGVKAIDASSCFAAHS
jgi:hypothetical protein